MASLKEYKRKRNFTVTAEPEGKVEKGGKVRRFVIQKHAASHLHYDFRLELGGTLVSWAVPKGPPMEHGEKRLAMKVEDHPVSYIDFEGTIPEGEYGGGTVQVWDMGTYEPLSKAPAKELAGGKLHVMLHGEKLNGEWYLVRIRGDDKTWLLIKGGEDQKKLTKKVEAASAISGLTLEELSKFEGRASDNKPKSDAKALKAAVKSASAVAKKAAKKTAAKKTAKKTVLAFQKHEGPPPFEVEFYEPMKARSLAEPPPGDWVYEVKFDGFRSLAYKKGKQVRLISRTNNDMSHKFPEVIEAVAKLSVKNAIIDGEIVALDAKGRTSFQLLQAYEMGTERPPICFYAFDLLELNGKSTRTLPLTERKEKLQPLLPEKDQAIRFSASLGGDAAPLLKQALKLGLEGIIGKVPDSKYEVGKRSGSWVKLKLLKQQEFVIGGYTDPEGSRQHIGALLVGVHEKGKLVYSGKVGTGFSGALLKALHTQFKTLLQEDCPFTNLPEERAGRYGAGITKSVMKECHWIKPVLVCQVKYAEWTRDGRLRQPVYLGLREDKEAKKVVREVPAEP